MPYFLICRAKFYPTGKRLTDSHSKGFASLSKDGDEKIITVHPLCSSPRLPITNVFIHLLDEQLFICRAEWGKTHLPSFFCPPPKKKKTGGGPCTVSTCNQAAESQMWGIGPSVCVTLLLQTGTGNSRTSSASLWKTKSKKFQGEMPLWMYVFNFQNISLVGLFFRHFFLMLVFKINAFRPVWIGNSDIKMLPLST